MERMREFMLLDLQAPTRSQTIVTLHQQRPRMGRKRATTLP